MYEYIIPNKIVSDTIFRSKFFTIILSGNFFYLITLTGNDLLEALTT